MPKNVFWPATLVLMGIIFLASNYGLLPSTFWDLWPVILIVVGLGGLITADRDEWLCGSQKKSTTKSKRRRK